MRYFIFFKYLWNFDDRNYCKSITLLLLPEQLDYIEIDFSFNKLFVAKQFHMKIIYYQFYMDITLRYIFK